VTVDVVDVLNLPLPPKLHRVPDCALNHGCIYYLW
jgi:hypothetical protein